MAQAYALRFISGKYQGGEFPLPPEREIVIGRSSDLDMVLVEDMVSRKHAKISTTNGQIIIMDLGSTNGTFVNGKQIDVARLSEGDRLQLGPDVMLRLTYWPETRVQEAEAAQARAQRLEPLPLSPREAEIADLVVEGLTNPDIASQLGISLRTVTTHLANIYRRLDVHSRAALTRMVMERRFR